MMSRDRRRYPRFSGEFQADVLNLGDDPIVSPWEAVLPAVALDVCRRGVKIRARYNVPIGALLSAVVYYKGQESLCLGEVIWKRPDGDAVCYGLYVDRWTKLEPALQDQLSLMETAAAA